MTPATQKKLEQLETLQQAAGIFIVEIEEFYLLNNKIRQDIAPDFIPTDTPLTIRRLRSKYDQMLKKVKDSLEAAKGGYLLHIIATADIFHSLQSIGGFLPAMEGDLDALKEYLFEPEQARPMEDVLEYARGAYQDLLAALAPFQGRSRG